MALTIVDVWVNDAPVIGRLDTIFRVVATVAGVAQAARIMLATINSEARANKRFVIFFLLKELWNRVDIFVVSVGLCVLLKNTRFVLYTSRLKQKYYRFLPKRSRVKTHFSAVLQLSDEQ
jgi:hypothetical protein